MSMVVVLPAPFGPSRATVSPGAIARSIPRTACTDPYDFHKPVVVIPPDGSRLKMDMRHH